MNFQRREIGISLLLTIISCGVYGLYWHYKVVDDLYIANGEDSKAIMDILLTIVTCGLYGLYAWYLYGKKLSAIRAKHNLMMKDDSFILILFALFGLYIVNYCIVQNALNDEIIPLVTTDSQNNN